MNEPNEKRDRESARPRPDFVSPGEANPPPEYPIAKVLNLRFVASNLLKAGDCESVAYRVAEIMVAAKNLYTESLPRLTNDAPSADQMPLYEELAGLRMALLHMRDLIGEFDDHFMDAMAHDREDDPTVEKWENPEEWTEEELEEEES
jgi:hypothetical protein